MAKLLIIIINPLPFLCVFKKVLEESKCLVRSIIMSVLEEVNEKECQMLKQLWCSTKGLEALFSYLHNKSYEKWSKVFYRGTAKLKERSHWESLEFCLLACVPTVPSWSFFVNHLVSVRVYSKSKEPNVHFLNKHWRRFFREVQSISVHMRDLCVCEIIRMNEMCVW